MAPTTTTTRHQNRLILFPLVLLLALSTLTTITPVSACIHANSNSNNPHLSKRDTPPLLRENVLTRAASFPFKVRLHPTADYTLYWEIENPGARNESLHALLVFNANGVPNFQQGWMGLGIGDTMLDADFIIVHHRLNNSVEIHEHFATGSYSQPNKNFVNKVDWIIDPIQGGFADNYLAAEFRRPTYPRDGIHRRLRTTLSSEDNDNTDPSNVGIQRFIAAWNPNSPLNWKGQYFDYHGDNRRGAVEVNLVTGAGGIAPVFPFVQKQIHGFGMMTVWLLLFPLGVYWARYRRSTHNWMTVHASVQIVGFLMLLAMFWVILAHYQNWSTPHAALGMTIISLIIVQVFLGAFNLLGLRIESIMRVRPYVRLFHDLVGPACLVMAVAQVALGLNILYPLDEPRGQPAWVVFFVLLAMWVIAFAATEILFMVRIRPKVTSAKTNRVSSFFIGGDKKDSKKSDGSGASDGAAKGLGKAAPEERVKLLREKKQTPMQEMAMSDAQKVASDLKKYTWDELDKAIQDGQLLVVGNNRYVYDVSRWISSHPGGQIILYTVLGTDITNDYFHDTSFDANDFLPKPEAPATNSNRSLLRNRKNPVAAGNNNLPPPQSVMSSTNGNLFVPPGVGAGSNGTPQKPMETSQPSTALSRSIAPELQPYVDQLATLTENDWKRLIKARRTHVHTRNAIQRLCSLLVGEIVPSPGGPGALSRNAYGSDVTLEGGVDSSLSKPYNPSEYRRYAMTSKTLVTLPGSRSPVYQLRFCLLYPYDLRDDGQGDLSRSPELQPFKPGQCVEIQARINGQYVSRYYTPISGNMVAFDVLVRIKGSSRSSTRDSLVPGVEAYTGSGDDGQPIFTPYLAKQRVADRQFKIRGPFGSPIVDPEMPLSIVPGAAAALARGSMYAGPWCPDRLYFVAGGSGSTPFLQLVRSLLLPVGEPLWVIREYTPQAHDELPLTYGEAVIPLHHYLDGWCYGVSATTGRAGTFPLMCLQPRTGPTTKLVLIHCVWNGVEDLFGLDILQGAYLAYGGVHLEVHNVLRGSSVHRAQLERYQGEDEGSKVARLEQEAASRTGVVGQLYEGRVTGDLLNRIIGSDLADASAQAAQAAAYGYTASSSYESGSLSPMSPVAAGGMRGSVLGSGGVSKKVVICGPPSFNSVVYDACLEQLDLMGSEVVLLGGDKWVMITTGWRCRMWLLRNDGALNSSWGGQGEEGKGKEKEKPMEQGKEKASERGKPKSSKKGKERASERGEPKSSKKGKEKQSEEKGEQKDEDDDPLVVAVHTLKTEIAALKKNVDKMRKVEVERVRMAELEALREILKTGNPLIWGVDPGASDVFVAVDGSSETGGEPDLYSALWDLLCTRMLDLKQTYSQVVPTTAGKDRRDMGGDDDIQKAG
ncbi:hypothetical protein HK102_013535 [Quaeritorhiza haematococci]|nr:hypothetical protein HK102_013535 [Quaeritorhiza haematococci]